MTVAQSGDLRLVGSDRVYQGTWKLEGETLYWYVEGETFQIKSNNDLTKSIATLLRVLKRRGFDERLQLEGCMTCTNFRMSGMARDMGRGQRGVCDLHQVGVEVCYYCQDYARISNDRT